MKLPTEPFGKPSAAEVEVAHQIIDDDLWEDDPVELYNQLLGKHGVDATGRIWSLACKLYDRRAGEWG